jgi:hypothetical protein
MERFLKSTFTFCAILIFCTLVFFFLTIEINRKMYSNAIITNNRITTLIIGDSHTELGINDSLLTNTLNISTPAEGYIFSYLKLKSILSNNNQIKNIMLGVSFHNFSSYYDKYIFGEKPYNLISQHIALLENKDLLYLFSKNSSIGNLILILKNSFKNIIKFRKNGYPFIGGYHIIKTPIILSSQRIKNRINSQYYSGNKPLDFSTFNISYLEKIVNLCREKNIGICFINTPLYAEYYSEIPSRMITEYNTVVKNLGVYELNLNDLKLPVDCFLPDGDHLNYKGAILTTKYLIEALNKQNESGQKNKK